MLKPWTRRPLITAIFASSGGACTRQLSAKQPTKPASTPPAKKPVRYDSRRNGNPKLMIGYDVKTNRLLYARWAGRTLSAEEIAAKELIPASLQKSLSAAVMLDMTKMDWPDEPDRKLLDLNAVIPVTAAAMHLVSSGGAVAGQYQTARSMLVHTLDTSNNGFMESLADHCGAQLTAAGLVKPDSVPDGPSRNSRAFVTWAENYARQTYGLSDHFRMINAHGLPGSDTLHDPRATKPKPILHKTRKGWVKMGEMPVPDAVLQAELVKGWRADPTAENAWGLLDGVAIMRHWNANLAEHLPLLRRPEDEQRIHKYARVTQTLRVYGKHGFTRRAMAGYHCLAKDECRCLYALAHGQKQVNTDSHWRFQVAAEVLEDLCRQPVRAAVAKLFRRPSALAA